MGRLCRRLDKVSLTLGILIGAAAFFTLHNSLHSLEKHEEQNEYFPSDRSNFQEYENVIFDNPAARVINHNCESSDMPNMNAVDDYEMTSNFSCRYMEESYANTGLPYFICLHPLEEDVHVSGWLTRSGQWEQFLTLKMVQVMQEMNVEGFIDIGANIGVHTLTIARLCYPVLAVEPEPSNAALLRASISLNRLKGNISLLHAAVSDRHTIVEIKKEKFNAGHSVVHRKKGSEAENEVDNMTSSTSDVATHTFDDLFDLVTFSSAVMKVDIEGYECVALRRTGRFLKLDIPAIFMEFFLETGYKYSASCLNNMIGVLEKAGYEHTFRFDSQDWVWFNVSLWETELTDRITDVVFVRPKALHVFERQPR